MAAGPYVNLLDAFVRAKDGIFGPHGLLSWMGGY